MRALNAAVAHHQPDPGLLHHTDRGSTYTSEGYRRSLAALGFVESMSRTANCFDNAVAESTIGTIKAELLEGWVPSDIGDLARALFLKWFPLLFYGRYSWRANIPDRV